ncbi:MAG: hypothetical protein CVU87_11705 [Firmicutes bacterium HGW-Firmicutes-12]|jgi:hypothetical protein|nr:MAG: hypothetical protein CVU87_11705 [Firmicutes bacterium HGW-Firmicutes-12]
MSKKAISLTIDSNIVAINGIRSTLDSGPYIDALTNRTLAPLRFIGEALGAKVEWLDLSRKIRITDGKKAICKRVPWSQSKL